MSTRCHVIIKEGNDELIFYRHSDGYPESVLPILEHFTNWLKDGLIRNNLSQSAGWLVILGAIEYKSIDPAALTPKYREDSNDYPNAFKWINYEVNEHAKPTDWKAGAFEPTPYNNYDGEYLYVVDLETSTVHIDGEKGYKYRGKFSDAERKKKIIRFVMGEIFSDHTKDDWFDSYLDLCNDEATFDTLTPSVEFDDFMTLQDILPIVDQRISSLTSFINNSII